MLKDQLSEASAAASQQNAPRNCGYLAASVVQTVLNEANVIVSDTTLAMPYPSATLLASPPTSGIQAAATLSIALPTLSVSAERPVRS